jgi:lipoprotein-anchoring transpeptidase ErfK/SrfK
MVRVRIGVAAIALTLAGSFGAMAQSYYPPPPAGYYPPPPGYYPPPPYASPPAYVGAPVPPRNVGQPSVRPPDGPGYDEQQAYEDPADEYAAPGQPYYAPPRGYPAPRPPADMSGGSADYTGSIRAPAAGAGPAPDRATIAALPPEDQPEGGSARDLPPQLHRQLVDYVSSEPAGTIIIDTPHTYLYLMLGGGQALRYGVGVGRDGFTWSGTERISHMSEWPDWHPPKEMIERQPYLPRFMAGGEGNPLGARALYLGNTVYRIHGTNQPSTIGHFVSSGCIRLTNEDVADLYSRVNLGTRVVVLPGSPPASAAAQGPGPVAR